MVGKDKTTLIKDRVDMQTLTLLETSIVLVIGYQMGGELYGIPAEIIKVLHTKKHYI